MKQRLLFLTAILILFSCKKDDDGPPYLSTQLKQYQTALMAHTWLQDSIGYPGGQNTIYQSPRFTLKFVRQNYYTGYENSSIQTDTFRYDLADPNIGYYWKDGETKDSSNFFRIASITDTTLILILPVSPIVYEWYHAK